VLGVSTRGQRDRGIVDQEKRKKAKVESLKLANANSQSLKAPPVISKEERLRYLPGTNDSIDDQPPCRLSYSRDLPSPTSHYTSSLTHSTPEFKEPPSNPF